MSRSFTLYHQAITFIANESLSSPVLLALCLSKGIKESDLKKIKIFGEEAASADLRRRDAEASLVVSQGRLSSAHQAVSQGIFDITILKPAVLEDLAESSKTSPEDISFVTGLSFAVLVAPDPEAKPGEVREESRSQDAQLLQIGRLVMALKKNEHVAAAFASRQLDEARLDQLSLAAEELPKARKARDLDVDEVRQIGDEIELSLRGQGRSWNSIHRLFQRVAKGNNQAQDLLSRLATAREQSKTGVKRKRKTKPA